MNEISINRENLARREYLNSIGCDSRSIDDVYDYCINPFLFSKIVSQRRLPLPDEKHIEDWALYLSEYSSNPLPLLRKIFPQLSFPIAEGISKSDAYNNAVNRGIVSAEGFALERPEYLSLRISRHPIGGSLPVLLTPNRNDFISIIRALVHRNEPVAINPSVNAQIISGLVNWDRIRKYKSFWMSRSDNKSENHWFLEVQRIKMFESWRFYDRLIVLCENEYSGVPASSLNFVPAMDVQLWREKSALIRLEHEFTHYTTKRLYGVMRNNILDELICDWAGCHISLGDFKANWFLTFIGLKDFPTINDRGRIHTYRGSLSDGSFLLLCKVASSASLGLEILYRKYFENYETFLIALTQMSLELLASNQRDSIFKEKLISAEDTLNHFGYYFSKG